MTAILIIVTATLVVDIDTGRTRLVKSMRVLCAIQKYVWMVTSAFNNGDVYTGMVDENGLPHGEGSKMYFNGLYHKGEIYQGGWMHGKKHGYGILKCGNYVVYDGMWQNGKEVVRNKK